MRISDVLTELDPDFPALTPSKLRFLEEQGLVEPRRTGGGYRQYSRADVERLRLVLELQRDRYLPLRVIREHLADLDAGRAERAVVPRLAVNDGERTGGQTRPMVTALAAQTGTDATLVDDLVEAGVISVDGAGRVDAWAAEVVQVAAMLAEHGVQARHLRTFRQAVDRQVALADQIAAPLRNQHGPSAHEQATSVAGDVGELLARLHTVLVRSGIARL